MDKTETSREVGGLQYLDEQLCKRIASFQSTMKWYRRRYYISSMSTVVLSALITVIAGWKPSMGLFGIEVNNYIIILSATITVVSAWGAFFAPKESWLLYASTLNRLRALKSTIEFMKKSSDEKIGESKFIRIFFENYQKILDEHNNKWESLRTAHNNANSADTKSRTAD